MAQLVLTSRVEILSELVMAKAAEHAKEKQSHYWGSCKCIFCMWESSSKLWVWKPESRSGNGVTELLGSRPQGNSVKQW